MRARWGSRILSTSRQVTKLVKDIVTQIESGEVDPLDIRLLDAYQELRAIRSKIKTRIDLDQMLNEVLETKVSRAQELARILASPEIYVEKIKEKDIRQLSKMIAYNHPIVLGRLEYDSLSEANTRVLEHIEAMTAEDDDDSPPPTLSDVSGFLFETEESVFEADLTEFADRIPLDKDVLLVDLTSSEDFDEFLKFFLYVVILISKGVLTFNPEKKTVRKKR